MKHLYNVFIWRKHPMTQNPLIAAYKKPALYVSLPSKGKWYDPKPKLSVDGELAIYPMSARDELITKTPDALFNGEATVALLESCCPDVTNPRQMPVNDLLVVLLGIRQASYGNELSVDIKCTNPECGHLNQMAIDGNILMSKVKENDYEDIIELENGFAVELTPYTIEDRTRLQIQQVKQQTIVQQLMDAEQKGEETLQAQFGKTFVEIAELTVELISKCISSVTVPDGETIDDTHHIFEWLKTITKKDYDVIRERVEQLSENNLDTMMEATCQECGKEYKTNVELDIAGFFAG